MGTRAGVISIMFSLLSGVSTAQVTVDFTVDRSTGCGTVQAQFTDMSSSTAGEIVAWSWDLGGVPSMLQHPGRFFADPGSYTICLTVTDASGNSASRCKTDLIQVFGLPLASFTADPVTGCSPLEVHFTGTSSSPNGDIVERIWDIGGSGGVIFGGVEVRKVSSTYSVPGQYTASLIVYDEEGCFNTVTQDQFVSVGGIAQIDITAAPAFGCSAPHDVDFTLSAISANTVYTWDFGNGQQFSGLDPPPATYSTNGYYSVLIYATDTVSYCADTFYFEDIVRIGIDAQPEPSTFETCLNAPVDFTDMAPDGATQYLWEFGDGNTSDEVAPRHRYREPGCFFVTLTKTYQGCEVSSTISQCINVLDVPPLDLQYDKLASCQLPASFNLEVLQDELNNVRWFLNNSDDPIHGRQLDLQVDTFGIVPFRVIGRAANGCLAELVDSLYIGPLEANLPRSGHGGCVPYQAVLRDSLLFPFNIVDRTWIVHTTPPQTLNGNGALFPMLVSGEYDLTLILTTDEGCRDTVMAEDYIRGGTPPEISFHADLLNSCSDTTVTFTNTIPGPVHSFFWTFGDGTSSALENPTHVYTDTGYFTVTLMAEHNGCFNVDSLVDYIYVAPPIAGFKSEFNCGDSTVLLTNNAIGADGQTWRLYRNGLFVELSNEFEPVFSIAGGAIYIIEQTVWNNSTGCTDTRLDTLNSNRATPPIHVSDSVGCAPFETLVSVDSTNLSGFHWIADKAEITNPDSATAILKFIRGGVFDPVMLTYLDHNGCRDTAIAAEHFLVSRPLARVDNERIITCPGSEIQFFDGSISPYAPITSWNWSFADSAFYSNRQNPVWQIDSTGIFELQLFITDSLGCTSKIRIDSAIIVDDFAIEIQYDTAGCAGTDIPFSIVSAADYLEYEWGFDDGSTYTGRSIDHQFDQDGIYEVCARITNLTDCSVDTCLQVIIESPEADFSADVVFGDCPPLIVNFTNTSSHASDYLWYFGDLSGPSGIENPAHVYTRPGTFDVTLIASRSDACADTLVLEDIIQLNGPDGSLAAILDTQCAPVSAQIIGEATGTYQFIWDFGDGSIDSSQTWVQFDSTQHLYTSPGSYLPKLILIDNANCAQTITLDDSIRVYPVPKPEFQYDTLLCRGDSLYVTTKLPDSTIRHHFQWEGPVVLDCDTCGNVQGFPQLSGWLSIYIENEYGCQSLDTIQVRVEELPELDVDPPIAELCKGDTLQVNVLTSVAGQFNWNFSLRNASCLDCQSPEVYPDSTGTYYVHFTDGNACVSSDSIFIAVLIDPNDYLKDTSACVGESVIFSLESYSLQNILWNGGGVISCDTCRNIVFSSPSAAYLSMEALNPDGCRVRDTSFVNFIEKDFAYAGEDTIACFGEIITLNAELEKGSGQWLPGPTHPGSYNLNYPVSPDSTTAFVFEASEAACTIHDTVVLTIRYKASIELTGDTICQGDTAHLHVDGVADLIGFYDPSNTELQFDLKRSLQVVPSTSTIYRATGYLSVCEADTSFAEVVVNELPDYDLPAVFPVYPGEIFMLPMKMDSTSGVEFHWTPEYLLSCTDCPNPELLIDSNVTLYVTIEDRETECFILDSIDLRVPSKCDEEFVFVPNAFSPNSDGVNDLLIPSSGKYSEIASFTIYDRWGSAVFGTSTWGQGWDGTLNNNALAPGVFTYILTLYCPIDGSLVYKTGDITLVR